MKCEYLSPDGCVNCIKPATHAVGTMKCDNTVINIDFLCEQHENELFRPREPYIVTSRELSVPKVRIPKQ